MQERVGMFLGFRQPKGARDSAATVWVRVRLWLLYCKAVKRMGKKPTARQAGRAQAHKTPAGSRLTIKSALRADTHYALEGPKKIEKQICVFSHISAHHPANSGRRFEAPRRHAGKHAEELFIRILFFA